MAIIMQSIEFEFHDAIHAFQTGSIVKMYYDMIGSIASIHTDNLVTDR